MLNKDTYEAYLAILKEELIPATGCTEPIALAYCAAKAHQVLGALPDKLFIEVSGNIMKNVKSVVVPNTGGRTGIQAAVAAGIVAGDADKVLQVIATVPEEKHAAIAEFEANTPMEIECMDTPHLLDIRVTAWKGADKAVVRIANNHSNIVYIAKNDDIQLDKPISDSSEDNLTDKSVLNVKDILEFANTVDLSRVSEVLDRQINCNAAIAQEGLDGNWGANVGSVLLEHYPHDIRIEARAWAAAGSDARMSGCELPVVILSGSGNQGITASMPIYRFATHMGVSHERLLRALLVSDLVTIEQKAGIGRLSAYCGAVSAGVGSGAAIAYLLDGSYEAVSQTIVNAVAIISGTICDGAKPSCAAKISAAVDAGIVGFSMYRSGQSFKPGDGIVTTGVDATIANIGVLAREGMQQTDRTILDIMVHRCK